MNNPFIQKLHAVGAVLNLLGLAVGTVIVLTNISIITMNHLFGLWLLAGLTGYNLWRCTNTKKQTHPIKDA